MGAAVRDNIVATFILNYLEELDKQLEEPCIKVMRLHAKAGRYWLEGSDKMGSDCLRDLCAILRVQLTADEEQLDAHDAQHRRHAVLPVDRGPLAPAARRSAFRRRAGAGARPARPLGLAAVPGPRLELRGVRGTRG